jgi:formyl-CoA transferase
LETALKTERNSYVWAFSTGSICRVALSSLRSLSFLAVLIEVDHPEIGKMKLINTPVKLLSVPIEEYIKATAPPLLGEHTDEVLSRVLGYTKEQLDQLHLENVIK